MLNDAIGGLLPSAVAVALSPIPIIAVISMLATPRARTNGPAFAIGWVVGLVLVSVVVLALAGGADDPDSTTATTVNWVQVGLGALLLALAAKQWRKRPRKGEPPEMPAWITTIDGFGAGKSLGFGIVLSAANPKNLALTMAAAVSIAQAGLSTGDEAIAVAVFVAIGSITVAGAVLAYLVAGRRAERPLAALKEFMADHSNVIMMVVLLVIGAKLLGEGFAAVT
jgi:threonine/homoserine/homoserine lactone efflux protein